MTVFVVPLVDCYHNLTKGFGYVVDKVEIDIDKTPIIYFHDDNDDVTVLLFDDTTESFVLMEA